jgi:hypothetical protein
MVAMLRFARGEFHALGRVIAVHCANDVEILKATAKEIAVEKP